MSSRVASIIALAALIAVVLALMERRALFGVSPIAIAVQVLAFLLMVWARLTFGARSFHGAADPTAGGLVTSGPYRWIRHPIYASILYFLAAGVLSHLTWISAALFLAALMATLVRALSEERLLVQVFPEYAAYAARTKRFVPFVV